MKALKNYLPVILFILFELAFGILLIFSKDTVTKTVLICFGIILAIIGVIYLIRFFREKKQPEKTSYLNLPLSIVSIAAAIFCIVYALAASEPNKASFISIIYGAIFIVLGFYKAKTYNDSKKEGAGVSAFSLISGVLSAVFGIVAIIMASKLDLIYYGIAFIVFAVLDLFAVAIPMSKKDAAAALPAGNETQALPDPDNKD
ncbi:MAG: DUF308 domain-containing protein [Clostridia bacterium]|nr:DUF308 domain-containing protein [Clostridia bacterium]